MSKAINTVLFLGYALVFMITSHVSLAAKEVKPGAPELDYAQEFKGLCDYVCDMYPKWHRCEYMNSYAVRALNVMYDLTREDKYLDVCTAWCEKQLDDQSRMIPEGAYYMGYHRKPGQNEGQLFVADCNCIAMAVLATAVRSHSKSDKKRYIDSVKSYADMVIRMFVRDSRGVANGYWLKSDKEWWCSTSLFASLAYLLYEQTGEKKYKKVADGATDWIVDFDYRKATTPRFDKQGAPMVMFYTLEALTAGMPHFRGKRRSAVIRRFGQYVDWIIQNVDSDLSVYKPPRGPKFAGLPFHLTIFGRVVSSSAPHQAKAANECAERILAYLAKSPKTDFQRSCFAIVSFCEKAYPNAIYHRPKSQEKPANKIEVSSN